jgi:3-hydroxybutyryl-CoA dehydratase
MRNSAGGYFFEDLAIGMKALASRVVSEQDVALFGQASGDMNPVHFDADFAATSRFGERIAHGMLTASHISALIGMELPGPGSVYISQSLTFKRPVKLGALVTTEVEVTELDEKKGFVTMATHCSVDGKVVLTGVATAMVEKRAA